MSAVWFTERDAMPEPPLTDAEKKSLRALIDQDRKVTWLWSSLGVWIKWGFAVAAGFVLAWEHIKGIARGLRALIGGL